MDILLKDKFIQQWGRFFGKAELPITFYYTKEPCDTELADIPAGWSCVIAQFAKVRKGKSLAFNADSVTCGGGKRYLAFSNTMRPGFEYFLSCGNAEIEGERYLQSPELVKNFMANMPTEIQTDSYIVFKRWDNLTELDKPDVVIFFTTPDVISGLFTLANFDQSEPNGTITPFGAGCSSIVHYPYKESKSARQRAVIGMFDPSARPCVGENILTFAVPIKRFESMVKNMEESFLATATWSKIKNRIDRCNP